MRREIEPSLAVKLGSSHVGYVNETAQTLCEKGFMQTLDDPRRFNTSYQTKY